MIVQEGRGGWAMFSLWGDDDSLVARVRFAMREDGRLEPAEVHIDGSTKLAGEHLRNLPLASMEAYANGRGREELVVGIAEARAVERATDRWLTIVGGGHRRPAAELSADLVQSLRRRALRLSVPKDPTKYPDAFYAKVAELYSTLAASGMRGPAQAIADANDDVEVTQVHRWIKEARRRGLLGSGRRGKAG